MRLCGGELKEIVAIASDHDAFVLLGGGEDTIVGRIYRERFAQLDDVMSMTFQRILDRGGNVVVEEELHSAGCSSWGSARRSISAG